MIVFLFQQRWGAGAAQAMVLQPEENTWNREINMARRMGKLLIEQTPKKKPEIIKFPVLMILSWR